MDAAKPLVLLAYAAMDVADGVEGMCKYGSCGARFGVVRRVPSRGTALVGVDTDGPSRASVGNVVVINPPATGMLCGAPVPTVPTDVVGTVTVCTREGAQSMSSPRCARDALLAAIPNGSTGADNPGPPITCAIAASSASIKLVAAAHPIPPELRGASKPAVCGDDPDT